jgi:DNA-binding transcriptional ArsR family regulator
MPENNTGIADEKLLILPLGEESKKITQVISNDTARKIIELLADAPLSASDIAERLDAPLTTITYNLENLESVGLIKVERIKYSEKGRKVKIYAPVRKVIVVIPQNTDRESVFEALRKYMGVLLAAVLASSVIEFFTKGFAMRSYSMDSFSLDLSTADNMPAPVSDEAVANGAEIMEKGGGVAGSYYDAGVTDAVSSGNATPVPSAIVEPVAEQASPVIPAVTHTPAPLPSHVPTETVHTTALQPEPGILANITDTILTHPGLVFLLGCLFVIAMLVLFDYIKKRKNR